MNICWRVSKKVGNAWLIIYEGTDYDKAKNIAGQTEGTTCLERI